jgi:hypothetical protein
VSGSSVSDNTEKDTRATSSAVPLSYAGPLFLLGDSAGMGVLPSSGTRVAARLASRATDVCSWFHIDFIADCSYFPSRSAVVRPRARLHASQKRHAPSALPHKLQGPKRRHNARGLCMLAHVSSHGDTPGSGALGMVIHPVDTFGCGPLFLVISETFSSLKTARSQTTKHNSCPAPQCRATLCASSP